MKWVCTIELPDNASPVTFLDAIAQAGRDERMWKKIHSRSQRMDRTDLTDKCGSCIHFRPWHDSDTTGCCACGHRWGKRTRPKCSKYEVTQEWEKRKGTFG
jgi:hypothetical protein